MGNSSSFDPSQNQNPFLADVFSHLPVLVSRLTSDGIVLQINPQVTQVTGYSAAELVGKNFWAMLFPGKLFAQVPRFISPTHPEPFLRDYPMTLRTRNGQERIVAWTRFVRQESSGASARKEIVCLGQDLTDRLTDAERDLAMHVKNGTAPVLNPNLAVPVEAKQASAAHGAEEGLILPLAISPPVASGEMLEARRVAEQTLEHLARAEARLAELHQTFEQGQRQMLETLLANLKSGTREEGGAALSRITAGTDRLHQAGHMGRIDAAAILLNELLKVCKVR